MGMPDVTELAGDGPPIRVCGSCVTEDDTHLGGSPTDITPKNPRSRWITCKRCGRSSRIGFLVDRPES